MPQQTSTSTSRRSREESARRRRRLTCRVGTATTVLATMLVVASPLSGATLASLHATVTLDAGGACGVHARFATTSPSAETIVHRLLLPPSDVAADVEVDIRGAGRGAVSRAGRTATVPVHVGAGLTRYEIRYRVPAIAAGRCPLFVPDAPTDGVSRVVEIDVRMPDGARRLPGEFPALVWTEGRGLATLGHVPAFVLLPHAQAGMQPSWAQTIDVGRLVDIGAIAFLSIATLAWWSRSRQRRAR